MSYLDRPRINFFGTFQSSPSTINNTPNNYDPAAYEQSSLDPKRIELYWAPKGDGIFDLIKCRVTNVDAPGVQADPLVGASVAALYTSAPPKLVDLDPMQQNVSELWGLSVMLGEFTGAYVQGTFQPVAFNGIWGISQGPNTPRSSASGAAVYQSTLTNLQWKVGNSPGLKALQAASPRRLSIRMVVSAHNNAPQLYAFTPASFEEMSGAGVPQQVLTSLLSLQQYVMNVDGTGKPQPPGRGFIPTLPYVNYLLQQLLGEGTANQWGPTILKVAQQPYTPWINYSTGQPLDEQPLFGFTYGKVVGAVGPCADDEPVYAVPARSLAPSPAPQRQLTSTPPPQPPPPAAWWAPAKLDLLATPPSLTIDLANSLPVPLPGRPLWKERLGTLSLAYYTGSGANKVYTTFGKPIDYASSDFIEKSSGLLVVTDFGAVDPKVLASLPIAVRSTLDGKPTVTLLEESSGGLSLRADQFVFRMNPGLPTTPDFPRGGTNSVSVYVRKFGSVQGTEGMKVGLTLLEPSQAANYTLSTLGTSGTNGINAQNTATPPGKLSPQAPVVEVKGGRAVFNITATDPGNPRGYVDGQVYLATYDFSPAVPDFHQDPNDVVSAQIYQQSPIAGVPSWTNGIGETLRQYGMLYPIMGRFQLWTYDGVVENSEKIQRVLSLDISQPLHMPVTRDLSTIRYNLIRSWFQAGMPYYSPLGPQGGPGTSWDNLPTVRDWGPMTSLVIRSGDVIDAIQPIYGANAAPSQGGARGTASTVQLGGDPIVAITGYTGSYFGKLQAVQLTFKSASGALHGPFGTMRNVENRQSFELVAPAGSTIRSFFGTTAVHTDGTTYIAAIGGNLQRAT